MVDLVRVLTVSEYTYYYCAIQNQFKGQSDNHEVDEVYIKTGCGGYIMGKYDTINEVEFCI